MSTIREVASRAGVSSTTVSHVINNTRFVSEEVRQRVQAAMDEIGYRPNELARSLRRGETKTLGLILPDSANPFFAEIGRSIEKAAFAQGYNVILCNTDGDFDRERTYVDVLLKKQVDGLVFVATGERSDSLSQILKLKVPIVVVDRDLPDVQLDTVLSDNYQGGYLATQYLINLGHRRIACISGPSHLTPSALRVTGYKQALLNANIPIDDRLILRGDFHPQSGWQATLELLALPDKPTAIFACNDLMAIGVLRAAAECGVQVPKELGVMGYDDIELSSYTTPALSTVRQPKVEIGQTAVRMLLERIQNKEIPPRRELLSATVIVRGTCGGLS
jgi:LacI family transcriptional regulator